jgi:hypothetical protein
LVKYLVETGADWRHVDPRGLTLLHDCAINDHLDILEYLMELGLDPQAVDGENRTPVYVALMQEPPSAKVAFVLGHEAHELTSAWLRSAREGKLAGMELAAIGIEDRGRLMAATDANGRYCCKRGLSPGDACLKLGF